MRNKTKRELGLNESALQTNPNTPGERHRAIEALMEFFERKLDRSPQHAVLWRAFEDLAQMMADAAPWSPEMTVALRKLLEAKDATERAVL